MPLNRIKKIRNWFDQHGLFSLSLFLLVFIPIYPKLPLLEAIPGYLVKVRLEDILIFLTGLIWVIQLFRKKIDWKNSFYLLIILYAFTGLLSLLIATFLQQTIPIQLIHLSKSLLHYFRYLEYFSLFLFMHAGVKNRNHTKIALTTIVITLNLVFIYGFGQRYLQWPAFSTMNREYSKGQSLILAPEIKLHSTFGGHYDLAAYLVIILPLILSWLLRTQKRLFKVWLGISILGGLWLLLESASKTALIGCLAALGGVISFSAYQRWGLLKSSLISFLTAILLGGSALISLWLWQKPTLYKLAPFLRPSGYQIPVDVKATLDENWSENAKKYGLSMGIRLDTLWPNALDAFSINPYTGKGYATLNKGGVNEFTEADSTDNNFLRVLGETGFLGFIVFFSLIILIIRTLTLNLPKDEVNQSLVVGFIAATGGLFINAFIIDVFAASKVAFTYWAVAGLSLKSITLLNQKKIERLDTNRQTRALKWLKKHWPIIISSIIFILLVHKRPFTEYSLVKSFALNTTEAKYVATTKCLVEQQGIKQCTDQYSPGLGITYSFYLLPFYFIYQEPAIYYFANLLLLITTISLFNQIIKKITPNSWNRFFILTIFFTMPLFYNFPSQSIPANLFLPLILFAISIILRKKNLQKLKSFSFALVLMLIAHLVILESLTGLTKSILSSWRDTYRPSNYAAVRRANRYLPSRIFADKPLPTLLTVIEPVIFDLYGQDGYQILPIEEESLIYYQDALLNFNQEIFITNANIELNEDSEKAFEKYKHNLGITLVEIDCRQKCNYYQLLSNDVIIHGQPKVYNKKIIPQQIMEPNILVINDQVLMSIGMGGNITSEKELLKQRLIDRKADVIFITGDIKEERLKHYGQTFLKRLLPELDVPIIAIPSDFNSPKYTFSEPQYQRFSWGDSWFITLDAAAHHSSPDQNRFIFDTLLQLEKHPEVKKVHFISHDEQWLQQHPDNFYFAEDFLKTIEKFKSVEFEFLYPTQI